MDELLGFCLKQFKGLGFAASAFALLIGFALTREDALREVVTTSSIWLCAFGLHWLGGKCLDRPFYDRLFGTKGRFKNVLGPSRTEAHDRFKALGWRVPSLQDSSAAVFQRSEAWERRVQLAYELSKAARTLVLPLLGLCVWELLGLPLFTRLEDSWLGNPRVVGGLFFLSTTAYLGLRVWHNRALYGLVRDAKLVPTQRGLIVIEKIEGTRQEKGIAYEYFCLQIDEESEAWPSVSSHGFQGPRPPSANG